MGSVSIFATVLSILAATVMQAYNATDNKCDTLSSVIGTFTVCLTMNSTSTVQASFMRLIQDDQALTRDKFLTELDIMCSYSEIKQPYLNCVEEIENDCIDVDIRGYISTNVDERQAFFCENNTASSWMHEVLPDDYRVDKSCILANSPFMTIFQTCFRNISETLGGSLEDLMNLSFNTALPLFNELFYNSFPCVMDQAEKSFPSDLKLDCGSAWQDVLLLYWLNHNGSAFGPVLRREEMHRIKAMMTTRSETGNSDKET